MSLQRMQAQIVRDSVPTVDSSAPRTARSWEWVCSALVNKERGECAVEILDTVFVQREQIWSWFYSSSGGVIRKKAQRKLTAANVVQHFSEIARAYEQNAACYVALCWLEETRRIQLLTAAECQTYLASCKGSACVSAFVHPRGDLDPTRYANLEHEYTLHKTGRLQGKLYRLALGNQRIMSMDNKLNKVASELVQAIVSYIERTRKCRVVHCVSYFVMDAFGRVILWRTEGCQTIALLGKELVSEGAATAVYDGPHAVSERVLARAKADATRKPDDKLIQAILASPTPASKRQTLLLQASASQPTLPSEATVRAAFDPFADDLEPRTRENRARGSQLRNSADWDEAMQFLPATSSLSRGRKRTLSAAHLISSQKKGCCGDYCDIDMRTWATKRLGSRAAASPAFDGSTNSSNFRGRASGGRSSSVISATTAATAFLTAHSEDSVDDTYGRKPMSPQRQQMEDIGKSGVASTPHAIPFKLIAQTRAEKQLVDLFVRRYQKGEDGQYLAEVYYGDGEPLGQTFPGYYYQDVNVCSNCFAFYTLVEDVRMKALDHLARRRSSVRAGDRQHGSSPGRPRDLDALREDREDADDDEVEPRVNELARRSWKKAWVYAQSEAMPRISKTDAAELFSFVNPHPAISMVITSLGILLTGRHDAGEVKRALSKDKLLVQLQHFSMQELQHNHVEMAAAHARNPLFSPVHIAPISSCAGRFCDWILSVLQAYAWKNHQYFRKDVDTWELLAYLKLDLAPSDTPRAVILDILFREALRAEHSKTSTSRSGLAVLESLSAKKTSVATAVARKAIQGQQMARLAAPTGFVEATTLGGNDAVFTCSDNMTKIPYTITGQAVGASTKCNLIVFNDFFDTMESTKVFFRSIVAKHVGARVLFFNLPGQAGTAYPASESDSHRTVFNNAWCAQRVHELLSHLQETSRFITSGLPFHIVGFGNGANVATSFAIQFGKDAAYEGDFQSIVLFNGFARVDSQLAAILHSTVNVFSCFPPARPDLPVTFFCKYLFSEGYLAKVDVNLALSIYTAVTNPITLDGRIRICQGALHHVDLSTQLPQIHVPVVLVQSVENLLVAPTSVDPFLQQRVNIAHSWSHQQQVPGFSTSSDHLTGKTKKQLQHVLRSPGSAFVSWLRAGHELRQEAKQYVIELLELIVCSRESAPDIARSSVGPTRREETASHSTLRASLASHRGVPIAAPSPDAKEPLSAPASVHKNPPDGATLKAVNSAVSPNSSPGNVNWKVRVNPHDVHNQAPDLTASRVTQPVGTPQGADVPRAGQLISIPHSVSPHDIRMSVGKPLPDSESAPTPSKPSESVEEGHLHATNIVLTCESHTTEGDGLPKAHHSRLAAYPDVPRPSVPALVSEPKRPNREKDATVQLPDRLEIDAEIEAVRVRMQEEEKRLQREADELRDRQRVAAEERMAALRQEQERRRRQWEEEDNARLAALEHKLREEQEARDEERRRRERGSIGADRSSLPCVSVDPAVPTTWMESNGSLVSPRISSDLVAPTFHGMKQNIRVQPDLPSVFDRMEAEERAKKRIGNMRVDDFDEVKKSMAQNVSHHVKDHDNFLRQELLKRKQKHAICIQKHFRRFLAVQRVAKIRQVQQELRIRRYAGGEIVRIVRGFIGRRRFLNYKHKRLREAQERGSAISVQRVFRGFVCRIKFRKLLRARKAIVVQRVFRGHRGRLHCEELRESLAQRKFLDQNAAKVQATWRMHIVRDRFLTQRISLLAATEIQRMYRGHLGRLEATRKKAWRDAEPGPERLALGLKMIEGSKQAFERQQSEIDALHRAQEAVERQVSTIHAELQDSEKELAILERELQQIDQLEADLRELTHEAEMLHNGGLEGILRRTSTATGMNGQRAAQPLGSGVPAASPHGASSSLPPYEMGIEDLFEGKSDMRKRQADAYAVEMAIQIKRAEREKKKKDLEAEFTSVFAEVQQKRQSLADMEEKLADMEATRMRKDREFARMQRNLMELLEEQKLELENLREKGIELETATATSAAAAAATAMKAKEHEKRSQAMFESTEELMKFQFMSMSLSYFSSLNMLKNLRDINADTTAAAISSTAETAAAAAAAAAAANIPTMKRLQVGGSDLMMAASQLKKNELDQKLKEEEDAKHANQQPLPDQVKDWTVDDVGRWLDSLSLTQYKKAFSEGAVDGEFLLELRPEDMSDVLGVSHKLHVRKIIVARNKLLPLSQQEQLQLDAVDHEEQARNARQGGAGGGGGGGGPSSNSPAGAAAALDVDTVFSQARNGRLKRVIESVDAGFDINVEDDKGNTLLLIACQNVNTKMVEFLVTRRANVNHKNAQGNTPLHFAMAYDTEGKLGEYLIARGADDTIENSFGLTAYDGLQPE